METITIIPAYNEEEAIKNVILAALRCSDVLVVDDGSTDHTAKLALESGAKLIKHNDNQGKGAAIKTGLKIALQQDYDVMVIMDGDGQHDPRYIPLLASGVKKNHLTIGSRFKKNFPHNMTLQRRWSNHLTTAILRLATGYDLTDSQSGFRAISPNTARILIDIPYNDYVFESETLFQAYINNMRVGEEAITCTYMGEKSYISWVNVLNYIIFVFKLLLRNIHGRLKF